MRHNYRHFNAAVCVEAADAYLKQLEMGNKMMITLAGAMSTAELGVSLAEMIRKDKVHIISCTGANLEEDLFNAIAHEHYERVPHYRHLSTEDEVALLARGMNRVTDTCIPEDKAFRVIEKHLVSLWCEVEAKGERLFPYEYMYRLLDNRDVLNAFQIPREDSWLLAAKEKNLPILTPGWEDSTMANVFVSHVVSGDVTHHGIVKSGTEQMGFLIDWYLKNTKSNSVGFFQIGGGIAGDFPICVVPLIHQDLQNECPLWSYFCQISDSTTSYGSYSGAVPNEKITWGKLGAETPRFVIESDASIVAPLIFRYILEA